ncbi:hypothetical protein IDVR_07220 [Intrasporangium sp. DVR]
MLGREGVMFVQVVISRTQCCADRVVPANIPGPMIDASEPVGSALIGPGHHGATLAAHTARDRRRRRAHPTRERDLADTTTRPGRPPFTAVRASLG